MKNHKIILVLIFAMLVVILYFMISDHKNNSPRSFNAKTQTKKPVNSVQADMLQFENENGVAKKIAEEAIQDDNNANDDVYQWNPQKLDWVIQDSKTTEKKADLKQLKSSNSTEAIIVDWYMLEDIQYKLKYFEEIDFEAYAPIFSKTIQSLQGKEIVVKGYVIPLFENEEPLALSANPYSSCFFCGQASPASVMSMYMKNKGLNYKMDDFKTFKGTLYLNYDDPNEFYYILKDVVQVK